MQIKSPFHHPLRQLLSVPAPLQQTRPQEEGRGHGALGEPRRPGFNT